MSATDPQTPRPKTASRLWVLVFLGVGLVLGLSLSYLAPLSMRYWRFLPPEFQEAFVLHTILTTMGIILLVALAMIYLKMYVETRARFALGITVVLLALLVQSFIQYPLVLSIAGPFTAKQGPFLSYADFFTVAAYTIFLYLSLE